MTILNTVIEKQCKQYGALRTRLRVLLRKSADMLNPMKVVEAKKLVSKLNLFIEKRNVMC